MDEKRINELNDTACEYPRDACVGELFEGQVARSPGAVAIVCGGESITYGQLNGRANQLAHRLVEMGVGRGVLVGVLMPRSVEFVVAALGILKAGGAYVPIDPDYPAERKAFMVRDTNAPVIVTSGGVDSGGLPIADEVCIDADMSDYPVTNPDVEITATDLAYVIYTSGSTGRPNGVEIPHRAIVRLIFGVDSVPMGAGQTFVLMAPTSFDASTFEMWAPLLCGGKLVVSGQPFPTRHLIDKNGITCMWLTAAVFNVVIEQNPEVLAGVDYLLVGGEAVSVKYARRAVEQLSGTKFIVGYGPTECTTFASTYPIGRDLSADLSSVPIGRPIGNTRMYILDPDTLEAVPFGQAGELYIGGDGLARGYHNRPELTAERFVADPFVRRDGARMYKTGDKCRYLPDGNIEFLGRFDDQVKLYGRRIELGEIEAALSMHPEVLQCAAVVKGAGVERRLAVYLTTTGASVRSVDELAFYLGERLPKFMVPSEFNVLDSMPLGATGKIDRRGLIS